MSSRENVILLVSVRMHAIDVSQDVTLERKSQEHDMWVLLSRVVGRTGCKINYVTLQER